MAPNAQLCFRAIMTCIPAANTLPVRLQNIYVLARFPRTLHLCQPLLLTPLPVRLQCLLSWSDIPQNSPAPDVKNQCNSPADAWPRPCDFWRFHQLLRLCRFSLLHHSHSQARKCAVGTQFSRKENTDNGKKMTVVVIVEILSEDMENKRGQYHTRRVKREKQEMMKWRKLRNGKEQDD